MARRRLVLNDDDEVVVRMYGQGFGDCFLLAFPRRRDGDSPPDRSDPVYAVIDCGVFYRTPRQKERMVQVTKSIKGATGGVVDLLVVTHEHYDHLCGFEDAKEDWKAIEVKQVWLAWTEDSSNPFTQEYDREKEALGLMLTRALRMAESYAQHDAGLREALDRALTLSAFGGESFPAADEGEEEDDLPEDDAPLPVDRPFRVPRSVSKLPNSVLSDLAIRPEYRFAAGDTPTTTVFCEPGQVLQLPDTDVDAYVLGPPTDAALLGLDLKEDEVYAGEDGDEKHIRARIQDAASDAFLGSQAAQQGFALALERYEAAAKSDEDERGLDRGAPFGQSYSIPMDVARESYFFSDHYFALPAEKQIATDWLRGAGRMALQLDSLTNNTSLVLAFRLPDGRYLLFVGDAQVGNWLSWHTIEPETWRRPEGGALEVRPTAQEILANTVVYKVGHHGSHNATLKAFGVEMMGDAFVAFVPSSRALPQCEQKSPWQIPFNPLIQRLVEKTKGRIVYPHEVPQTRFSGMQVETAGSDLPAMRRGDKVIESPVPLWRQVRIAARSG